MRIRGKAHLDGYERYCTEQNIPGTKHFNQIMSSPQQTCFNVVHTPASKVTLFTFGPALKFPQRWKCKPLFPWGWGFVTWVPTWVPIWGLRNLGERGPRKVLFYWQQLSAPHFTACVPVRRCVWKILLSDRRTEPLTVNRVNIFGYTAKKLYV